MGRLKDGKWIEEDLIPKSKDGAFLREEQKFKDIIVEGGKYPPGIDERDTRPVEIKEAVIEEDDSVVRA